MHHQTLLPRIFYLTAVRYDKTPPIRTMCVAGSPIWRANLLLFGGDSVIIKDCKALLDRATDKAQTASERSQTNIMDQANYLSLGRKANNLLL
jgi:hypothetical protein